MRSAVTSSSSWQRLAIVVVVMTGGAVVGIAPVVQTVAHSVTVRKGWHEKAPGWPGRWTAQSSR